VIVDYIDAHKTDHGVEPICRVLSQAGVQIAPSTYYAAKTRGATEHARTCATIATQVRLGLPKRVEVAGEPVVADRLQKCSRTVSVPHLDSAARQLLDLLLER